MVNSRTAERQPVQIRLAEVLAALSLATDLGAGKPMGHALRACTLGMRLAGELGLPRDEQAELYYSFLLMHSGCTVLSLGLAPVIQGNEVAAIGDITLWDDSDPGVMLAWMGRNVAPGAPLPKRFVQIIQMLLHSTEAGEHQRGACEVAHQVAKRLGMPPGVQAAVRHYLERWDGKGPYGLAGEQIPLAARLLQLALKVEAITTALGRESAAAAVRAYQGKIFDSHLAGRFLALAEQPSLWEMLETADLWEAALNLEPDSPYRWLDGSRFEDIALAVADFVDLKSPHTVGHSRETARIAETMARQMGLSHGVIMHIRRAALVHDLGRVALPARLLEDSAPLSPADQEQLRLHPYYTERILSRVPALIPIAAIAGRHQERLDGRGYYRGLSGSEIPLDACIVALADEYQQRCQPRPGRPKPDPKDVFRALEPEVGLKFSPECFAALAEAQGVAQVKAKHRREWPAGLTDREVEVLRELATGASNRQIANRLFVSEKTIAHHLQHIYNKIGISSRAAAVFFAMEHDLIN
jgi:HD-GYP domain-containing protein (c-di-GMP phosphodiesterase class II)